MISTAVDASLTGKILRQAGGPFSAANLQGDYVWHYRSSDALDAAVGILHATAAGASTGLSNGELDENYLGYVEERQPFTGTYQVTANGRGTATMTFSTFGSWNFAPVFYMTSPGHAFLLDAGSYATGEWFARSADPWNTAALQGAFAFGVDGTDSEWWINYSESGVFTPDGLSSAPFLLDWADSAAGRALDLNMSSTYTLSPAGRGELLRSDGWRFVFYPVSTSKMYLLLLDSYYLDTYFIVAGSAERQNLP